MGSGIGVPGLGLRLPTCLLRDLFGVSVTFCFLKQRGRGAVTSLLVKNLKI